ncbi:MAG: hypothetical protein D6814_14385 [Calditrichaeota bacterium]|nr:MAG: hypothetical protein D6814_14385 [Calditrichota bacterium]
MLYMKINVAAPLRAWPTGTEIFAGLIDGRTQPFLAGLPQGARTAHVPISAFCQTRGVAENSMFAMDADTYFSATPQAGNGAILGGLSY